MAHRLLPQLVPLALLSGALLAGGDAAAQRRPMTPLGGEAPTSGVRLHVPALVGGMGAATLEVNPGALGLIPAWNVVVHHTELRGDGRMQGTGDGLFGAVPLPIYRQLVFGAGFQWLRPADAIGYPDTVKLSFGLAWRPRPWFSLGLSLHTLISDGDTGEGGIDGLGALDAGVVVRPLQWIAAGVSARNINTPVYHDLPLQRVYDIELAVRPLSNRRIEIGAGFQLGERRGDLDPHFRASVEPLPGMAVFGHVELLRRDFYRTGERTTDVRVSTGLRVDFERFGFALSTMLGRGLDAGPGPLAEGNARSVFQGGAISVHVDGQRQRPLFDLARRLVAVELKGRLGQRRFVRLVQLLRTTARRGDVTGVLLLIDGLASGWGQAQELRAAVAKLRRKGKKVYAYLRAPGAREYYVAAAADRVLLDPAGGLRLQGVAWRTIYLRGLFDKIGVTPQFERIAEYKTAPEMYTSTQPSKPAKRVQRSLVVSIFDRLLTDVARDRGLARARLRRLIDSGPFTAPTALKAGLVDAVVSPERLRQHVQKAAGAALVPPQVLRRTRRRWPVGSSIAVVLVEGDIVRGKSSTVPLLNRRVVGDETIARALNAARRSRRVKAVVLRINSPGGSAMASDRMWRAVKRLRAVKPVFVSLGDVAASGGYFAACAGSRIYAQPLTITGSIGIFTGKFDLSGLLKKLGISTHAVSRGKRAMMDVFERSYTADERRAIRKRLRHFYNGFVRAVAEGRGLSFKSAEKVARGRVWTGAQARARRLVDRVGGLWDALSAAAERAGLADDRPLDLLVLPRQKRSLLSRAIGWLTRSQRSSRRSLPAALRTALRRIPPVLWVARPDEPLARLPHVLRY